MAVRGRAVHKNHNPTHLDLQSYFPVKIYFLKMDACPGHILASTQGIDMKLGL